MCQTEKEKLSTNVSQIMPHTLVFHKGCQTRARHVAVLFVGTNAKPIHLPTAESLRGQQPKERQRMNPSGAQTNQNGDC